MTWTRTGGALLIVGLVALTLILGPMGGPATATSGPVSALVPAGAALAFAIGALLFSAAAPGLLRGRLLRAGLVLLALAALGGALSGIAGIGYQGDPLGSWPIVGPLIVALVTGVSGLVSIAIALLRSSGPARAVGSALALGLVSSIPAGIAFGDVGLGASGGLTVLGLLGVGFLALRSGERL